MRKKFENGSKFITKKKKGSGRTAPKRRQAQQRDDDFTKDAKKFKKFVEASRAAKVETAKDKVNPMKGQRLFMDTSKFRQKANVKKLFETGKDSKTGQKLKTKISLNRIKDTFKNHPKMLKEKVEDFYKPSSKKRNLAKGGRAKMMGGGMMGRRFGMKKGSFPDLSGDGKITQKDILMGRGVIKKKKK